MSDDYDYMMGARRLRAREAELADAKAKIADLEEKLAEATDSLRVELVNARDVVGAVGLAVDESQGLRGLLDALLVVAVETASTLDAANLDWPDLMACDDDGVNGLTAALLRYKAATLHHPDNDLFPGFALWQDGDVIHLRTPGAEYTEAAHPEDRDAALCRLAARALYGAQDANVSLYEIGMTALAGPGMCGVSMVGLCGEKKEGAHHYVASELRNRDDAFLGALVTLMTPENAADPGEEAL